MGNINNKIKPNIKIIFRFSQVYNTAGFLDWMGDYSFYDESLIPEDYLEINKDPLVNKVNIKRIISWSPADEKLNPINNVCHVFQCQTKSNLNLSFGNILPENAVIPDYNFFFCIDMLK